MWIARRSGALLFLALLSGCDGRRADVLSVAAASSLRGALEAAAPSFEAKHPGLRLELSFDASSTHARQIAAGAELDVFLSADERQIERVADRLDPSSRRTFLANRLVLVARPESADELASPADLVGVDGHIAIAGPEVPVGRYARQWLAGHGLLTALEPRFAIGRNARATLALVESGAADSGFVYASDQRLARGVVLVWTAPPGDEPRIAYVAARLAGAGAPQAGEFLDWLASEDFQRVAGEQGFVRLDR